MKKLLQSLFIMLFIAATAFGQERTITGTVTGKDDGQPIPGVSVKIKGSNVGTTTGADGKYSLRTSLTTGTIEFSSIGYLTQSRSLASTSISVSLATDSKTLTDVVVTGYTTQSKRDVTGSIASVGAEKLKNQPIQSFEQALAGKAAGVNIIQPNGVLNNPPVFRVRGFNSISLSSYPLVIVDGIPVFTGDQSSNSASGNALGDINPADIESIDILKDAASSAIYGSRAANGVVVITTKKGKQGSTRVNYEAWVGSTKAQNLTPLLNAAEYVQIKNEARTNIGLAPAFFLQTKSDGTQVDTDWYDYAYRTATSQNHALNFSGATEKTSYYVSLGYSNQEGFIQANSFERKSGRVNLDHKLFKGVTIGTNFSYSNTMNRAPNTGSLPGQTFSTVGLGRLAIVLPPNVSPYNEDGSYNMNGSAVGLGANTIASNFPNSAVLINEDRNTSESDRIIGNVYASIQLLKGLTFKTSYGLDNLKIDNNSFVNRLQGDGVAYNGGATSNFVKNNRWNWANTLNYNNTFGDHSLGLLLGAEDQSTSSDGYGATRQNVIDPFIKVYQGAFGIITPAGLVQGDNTFRSYFANVNYDYKKRYFLTGSFRRDGYSGLSAGNKYGNFGGASAGWAISEENFYKDSGFSKVVSRIKLRGSYGEVGNINIGNYPALFLYSPGLYGADPALSFSQAGNPNLQWETSKKTDVGLSLEFLSGRFSLDVDYYHNDINNLVQFAPQAPSKGVPGNAITTNVGAMYNKGFEFTFNSKNINTDNFSWNTTLTFSTLKNEVTALGNNNADLFGATQLETANITRVGYPIGSIYTVKTGGVDPATGERIFINRNGERLRFSFQRATAARYQYMDGPNAGQNAPAIDAALDAQIIGPSIPKWFGGLDNNFRYKDFDLTLGLTFSGGNKIYYGSLAGLRDQRFWNNEKDVLNRWTTPGQVTDIPRLVYGDNTSNGSAFAQSQNVFSGNFLKVRNLALGYTLPQNFLSKYGISSVRVYAQSSNLWIISNYPGPDPEVSVNGNSTATGNSGNLAPGVDRNSVPSGRTFTFGLNVGF
ncbi:TonB-dependent receptor [Pedobacter aquatilis]|uniref:SusC/RagA family TonB-linked outer membrane protein n=1 Tax=Pedobacter aquatilis TaxID=351343 RepID=UPI0025B3394A|nr:TonB-dependent receptor [Pedobacter aquatilis]MDN3586987.1 TonB-dependent receptor [Pedobacter aquatilis]